MKKLYFNSGKLLSIFIFFSILILTSCSQKPVEENKRLITPDSLSAEDTEYLKERGFLENGNGPVCLYYRTTIKDEGIVLLNNKLIVYSKDTVESELLENIFDLSSSHSDNPETKSTITVYRKDNTMFKYGFPGNLDIDERFFSELRQLWRKVIAENQTQKTDPDSADGVFLGVKKKENPEKNNLGK